MDRKKYARSFPLLLFLASSFFCSCLGGGKEEDGPKKSDPPQVAIIPTSISIPVPRNLPQTFTIYNIGGDNNSLDNMVYVVADNGALGGFLNVQPISGSLAMGQSQVISVSVIPDLMGAFTDPFRGATLGLNVWTPKADNRTNSYVTVNIVPSVSELFVVNLNVTGSTIHVTGTQICVNSGSQDTCGPSGGFAMGGGTISVMAEQGTSYTVFVPGNQPAATYCGVTSGGSGIFGSSMPTAVITCN